MRLIKRRDFSHSCLHILLLPTRAWGCKGHEAVALIAEKPLSPEAKEFALALLKENPVDPQLKRYCISAVNDPMVTLLPGQTTFARGARMARGTTLIFLAEHRGATAVSFLTAAKKAAPTR